MKCLLLLLLSLLPVAVGAHPGWGIVLDRQGNVFYTDLENVWRIDAAGRKIVVRANGTVETLMHSPAPWQPTRIVGAANGAYWVLEYAGTQARVRRTTNGPKK